ncbi:MAG: glycosyltransferase family 2 protein [Pseudomonadota bacterium]
MERPGLTQINRDSNVAAPKSGRGGGLRARKAPLGELLVKSGAVELRELDLALTMQSESRAKIGEILVAVGATDRDVVTRVAAAQFGVPFEDLSQIATIGDPADPAHLDLYLRHEMCPIDDQGAVFAAADPHAAYGVVSTLAPKARMVMAEPRALRARIVERFGGPLADRAASKRPEASSLRRGAARWQRGGAILAAAALVVTAAIAPHAALVAALWLAAFVMGGNVILWLAALATGGRPPEDAPATTAARNGSARLADFRPSPTVSLLIPLYREPETVAQLITALEALDYPRELLDVKIILEANDHETRAAIAERAPPPFIDVLIAPTGAPQTKPRALNFALEFAKGDIIGVYDAEDRPPSDQLRDIVARFAAAPPDVACIQARLGYYNVEENLITRCFEIEYASWFDTMLPGLRRLGLPLPLGGTSLFIRRRALEDVGGWDSHNVTEDADLGVMLARAGFRTELSPSMTQEEASSRAGVWVRQRSRWLKGYLATWVTHMREPRRLLRDLGWFRFLGVNILLLSGPLGYMISPMLWFAVPFGDAITGGDPAAERGLGALRLFTAIALPVWAVAAFMGLRCRGRSAFAVYMLCAPVYWLMGAVAAYLAFWELLVDPTKWRKTRHGLGRIAGEMREAAKNAS